MNSDKVYIVFVVILAGNAFSLPVVDDGGLQEQILKLYGAPRDEQAISPPPPLHPEAGNDHPINIDPAVLSMVFGNNLARTINDDPPTPPELPDNIDNRGEHTTDNKVTFDSEDRFLSRTLIEGQFHGKKADNVGPIWGPSDKHEESHDAQKGPEGSNHIPDGEILGPKYDSEHEKKVPIPRDTEHLHPRFRSHIIQNEFTYNHTEGPEASSIPNPAIIDTGSNTDSMLNKEPRESNKGLDSSKISGSEANEYPKDLQTKSSSKPVSKNSSSKNYASVTLFITILLFVLS